MVRVLVTGSNGSAGRVAVTAIREAGHWVRGLDRAAGQGNDVYDRSASESRWHKQPHDFIQADLIDKAALARAMEGIEVVIHLAGIPDDLGAFDAPGGIMESNVLGVYVVCDAARTAGVKRVMLTSSQQAVTGLRIPRAIRKQRFEAGGPMVILADGTAPTNLYALTKVFSETMGQMYARGVHPRFPEAGNPSMQPSPNKMSVVITRLGWFIRNAQESVDLAKANMFSYYLSHNDAGRYFVRVVESRFPEPGNSVICYAQSKTPHGFPVTHSNDEARDVLGYEPLDVYPDGSPFICARPWPVDALQADGAKL